MCPGPRAGCCYSKAERRAWAARQRAACEWLLQKQYQHAVGVGDSQLDALRAKVGLGICLKCRVGPTSCFVVCKRGATEATVRLQHSCCIVD